MAVPADEIAALQTLVERTARDPELSEPERARALRTIREDLSFLVGAADTYLSGTELAREGAAVGRQRVLARARTNARVREALVRDGRATAEEMDELGYLSAERLDALEADGTLEATLLGYAEYAQLQEASLRGATREAAQILRLPNGEFAPKGQGRVLRAGQRVSVPHKSRPRQQVPGRVTAVKGAKAKVKLDAGPDAGVEFDIRAEGGPDAAKASPGKPRWEAAERDYLDEVFGETDEHIRDGVLSGNMSDPEITSAIADLKDADPAGDENRRLRDGIVRKLEGMRGTPAARPPRKPKPKPSPAAKPKPKPKAGKDAAAAAPGADGQPLDPRYDIPPPQLQPDGEGGFTHPGSGYSVKRTDGGWVLEKSGVDFPPIPTDEAMLRKLQRLEWGQKGIRFHGSDAPPGEIEPGLSPGSAGLAGGGVYLAQDPEQAQEYGKHVYMVDTKGLDLEYHEDDNSSIARTGIEGKRIKHVGGAGGTPAPEAKASPSTSTGGERRAPAEDALDGKLQDALRADRPEPVKANGATLTVLSNGKVAVKRPGESQARTFDDTRDAARHALSDAETPKPGSRLAGSYEQALERHRDDLEALQGVREDIEGDINDPDYGESAAKEKLRAIRDRIDERIGELESAPEAKASPGTDEFGEKRQKLEQRVGEKVRKGVAERAQAGPRSPAPSPETTAPVGDPNAPRTPTGKASQKELLAYAAQAASQPTTIDTYSVRDPDTGRRIYDQSRREVHEAIIARFLEGIPSQEQPSVFFSGGGYASGKGGVVDSHQDVPADALVLDPDKVKAELPEFQELLETDPEANLLVYEEAWDISQEIQRRAAEAKMNVVVDGISDTSPEDMLERVRWFRERGYTGPAKVVYVTIPTEEAISRARTRAEKAKKPSDRRHIPEVIMRSVHRDVSATMPGVIDGAGELGLSVEVWENNQGQADDGSFNPPKQIYAYDPETGEAIMDRSLWQEFLDKGTEEIEGVD